MQDEITNRDIPNVIPFGYAYGMAKKNRKNNLEKLRRARKLTQVRLADMVGTTEATISRLETGERRLNSDWLDVLSKALNCQPEDIIKGAPSSDSELAQVVALYDRMSAEQRRLRFRLGDTLAEQHNPPANPDPEDSTPTKRRKASSR